jgi:PAS domain S-box-containing protein
MAERGEKKEYEEIIMSRDFLQSVLENLADGVLVADMKGIIVHVNKTLSEMLGYSSEEMIGKHASMLRPIGEDTDAILSREDRVKELVKKGKVSRFHQSYQAKDGRWITVDIHITLLKDPAKGPIGSIAIIRDLSQRIKMERDLKESEERFRNLVEMANDGIVMADGERKIILFNRKAEEIYGYKRKEVIGKNVEILIPPQYRGLERGWYNGILKTGISPILEKPVELESLRKDGSKIPLEYSFSMYREEKGFFSMAVVRDITERKKLERELIEKEKLSALMELAGATAHELNQPLTTILGAAEILMRKAGEKDPQLKQLSLIAKETQRLSGMIKKIRKVIRYETKPYLDDVKIIDLDKASKKRKP